MTAFDWGDIVNTQEQRIMQYLSDFGSITALEALRDLGVMRLASRVCDLRQKGVDIKKKTEHAKNRYGERCTFVRYYIDKTG